MPIPFHDILACPICKGPLSCDQDALRCGGCKLAFPVRSGIFIFLREEARKEDAA